MTLRLLHSADWQIGQIQSQFEPDDASALFEARFKAVERLAALANQHQVDAVLVAGDVFDAQTVSDKTMRRLFNAMQGFEGPWFLLPGNHDAALPASVWTRAQKLHVIPPQVTACLEPRMPVLAKGFALLPAPLVQRHTHEDLTAWYADAATPEGLPRIGMAHGCVQGILPEDIDSANPIAADRAAQARLDYLALGDWHGCKAIDERTWYAGTPETDRFRANDSGHALLVTLQGPGAPPQVTRLRTGQFNWQQMEHTLKVPSDVDQMLHAFEACGRDDVLKVRLSGTCDLAGHERVQAGVADARAKVRALAFDASGLRLEPTLDDLAALQAHGYVREALDALREELTTQPTEVARDALFILARMLQAKGTGVGGAA